MKNVLIIDTETTGLDPKAHHCIEVGCILYSLEYATALISFASLIESTNENPAEAINRIPAAALRVAGASANPWNEVRDLADRADAIVAHRAEFDRQWVPDELKDRPWVCSKFDIRWPKQTSEGPGLVSLALEHDLGVAVAHRALADCDLIARLFTRSRELGADLGEMMARAMRPKAKVVALVSYDDRELAKKAGFQWDGGAREWSRVMFAEDVSSLPFKYRQVSQPQ